MRAIAEMQTLSHLRGACRRCAQSALVNMRAEWKVVGLAVCVRICQALLMQTSFSPDEFWQSLEVAHRIVFG